MSQSPSSLRGLALAVSAALATVAMPVTPSVGRARAASTITTVRLQHVALQPAKITVRRGTTVRWVWLDQSIDTEHNVTSLRGGRRFRSSQTMTSGSYAIRFNKSGRYFYECSIHPASMRGEIVVR